MSNEPLEWDFFLAHASADRNRAESLYEALRTDHRVFLDTHSVHPGDDWARTIQRALGSARFTIILISANSEKAHYLQDEIRTAIQLARQDAKRRRVIPVFLDGFPSDINAVPYGSGFNPVVRRAEPWDGGNRSRIEEGRCSAGAWNCS